MRAIWIKTIDGFTNMRLYRCEPGGKLPEHVVVSAINVPFTGPETYIFEANKNGTITQWGELYGSFRGGLDHEKALRDAGYEVAS